MIKKCVSIILVVVLLSITAFKWPMSFDAFFMEHDSVLVIQTKNDVINGVPSLETKRYTVNKGSDEYEQLKSLFADHSYHRRFSSLYDKTSFKGDKGETSYMISFAKGNDAVDLMLPYENGGVIIDSRIYSLSSYEKLVSGLEQILVNLIPEE